MVDVTVDVAPLSHPPASVRDHAFTLIREYYTPRFKDSSLNRLPVVFSPGWLDQATVMIGAATRLPAQLGCFPSCQPRIENMSGP
jgi:hypothetical protein